MPSLPSRSIDVALDMFGCPSRCRHCWAGVTPNARLAMNDLREVHERFRSYTRRGEREPFFRRVRVLSWYREPDFPPNYRDLYALERELNGGESVRHELLSIWRLARDESYAQWAREIGTEKCQITFFGGEATTDYFVRRKGAFRDCLTATERLLKVGVLPRWQVFLTRRGLGELHELAALAKQLDLERRAQAIGREFEAFVSTPSPDGEAWDMEDERIEADDVGAVPPYLAKKTLEHEGVERLELWLGRSEADLWPELISENEPWRETPSVGLAFLVSSRFNVYSNVGEETAWWCLGNLRDDGLDEIMGRFEADATPGMQAHFQVPVCELTERFGDPAGRKLYSAGDLKRKWVRQWAQEQWRGGEAGRQGVVYLEGRR